MQVNFCEIPLHDVYTSECDYSVAVIIEVSNCHTILWHNDWSRPWDKMNEIGAHIWKSRMEEGERESEWNYNFDFNFLFVSY